MKIERVMPPDQHGRVVVFIDEPLAHRIAPPSVIDERTRITVAGGPEQPSEKDSDWLVGLPGKKEAFLIRARTAIRAWELLGLRPHFSAYVVRPIEIPLLKEGSP